MWAALKDSAEAYTFSALLNLTNDDKVVFIKGKGKWAPVTVQIFVSVGTTKALAYNSGDFEYLCTCTSR